MDEVIVALVPALIEFLKLAGSHPITAGIISLVGFAYVTLRWRQKDGVDHKTIVQEVAEIKASIASANEKLAAHDANDTRLDEAVKTVQTDVAQLKDGVVSLGLAVAKLETKMERVQVIDDRTFEISTTIHAFLEGNRGKPQ